MSINPKFKRNFYHETLLKCYVFDEELENKPSIPSYFGGNFFQVIKNLKNLHNLENVTLKQIYGFFIGSKIKIDPNNVDTTSNYKLLKCEEKLPEIDWNKTWKNVRTNGLSACITSFLLKMAWNILPTEQRIARIFNGNECCKFCLEKRNVNVGGTIEHFLIQCPENCGVSEKIINLFKNFSNIDSKILNSVLKKEMLTLRAILSTF